MLSASLSDPFNHLLTPVERTGGLQPQTNLINKTPMNTSTSAITQDTCDQSANPTLGGPVVGWWSFAASSEHRYRGPLAEREVHALAGYISALRRGNKSVQKDLERLERLLLGRMDAARAASIGPALRRTLGVATK